MRQGGNTGPILEIKAASGGFLKGHFFALKILSDGRRQHQKFKHVFFD